HLVRVGQVAAAGRAAVVLRPSAVEDGGRAPQRVVRARQQHLVAGLQQSPQSQVDQLADPVADEDALGLYVPRSAAALLRGDCLARRFQSLLVAVGVALVQVTGDRLAQVRRRLEAVAAGVADIQ